MLRGNAFMIMWHDIAPEAEAEYHHWHSKQHMPERLGHRGFRRSRRGVNETYDRQRFFTLYEGDTLETFVSQDYLKSLDGPTEWTTRMAPHFRNFTRCACLVQYTIGRGLGGAFTTIRAKHPTDLDESGFIDMVRPALDELLEQPTVCGVHLAAARPGFSNRETRETALRPAMGEEAFDLVLIVESFGLAELAGLQSTLEQPLRSLGCMELTSQSYNMAYALEKD